LLDRTGRPESLTPDTRIRGQQTAGLETTAQLFGNRDGRIVPQERIWPLLDMFFEGEMHRQNVVPGAAEALSRAARWLSSSRSDR